MLLAMVDDLRVIFIKLADRLHNMRTLQYLPPEKQRRVAQETLDIYAPLAHRLGMAKIRSELEDLAFSFLDPLAYQAIQKELDAKRRANEDFLKQVASVVTQRMAESKIPARIEWRIKRPYSISEGIWIKSTIYWLFVFLRKMFTTATRPWGSSILYGRQFQGASRILSLCPDPISTSRFTRP
jgi:(p)ppGpp synthase/HD superfamily hydrolase